jgi:hypothetical protein
VVIEQTILNCGSYPLNTWLNPQPLFVSQMDEITKGTHIMDGMYELQQTDTGESIKMFQSQFEQPENSKKVQVVNFSECSPQLMTLHDIDDSPMLKACDISVDDFNGLIGILNQKLLAHRGKLVM